MGHFDLFRNDHHTQDFAAGTTIFKEGDPGDLMYISFGMVFLLFFTGLIYFKKVEDQMADFV